MATVTIVVVSDRASSRPRPQLFFRPDSVRPTNWPHQTGSQTRLPSLSRGALSEKTKTNTGPICPKSADVWVFGRGFWPDRAGFFSHRLGFLARSRGSIFPPFGIFGPIARDFFFDRLGFWARSRRSKNQNLNPKPWILKNLNLKP